MITNSNQLSQPVINLLEEIQRSPIAFHLTGSRFFGTEHQNSDFDFFVSESAPGLGDFLGKFCVRADSETDKWSPSIYLGDPTIATIWTNANWPTNPNERVHIQVIKHQLFHIKEAAQKIIKDRNLICRGVYLSSDVVKKINKFTWMSVQWTLIETEQPQYCGHVNVSERCRRCGTFADLDENHSLCQLCWIEGQE